MDISRFNGLRSRLVSVHSYSRCWIHLIWGTLSRERILNKKAAAGLSQYLVEYAGEQDVYMKINFVNADHVHALIDLPTGFSIEKMVGDTELLYRELVELRAQPAAARI